MQRLHHHRFGVAIGAALLLAAAIPILASTASSGATVTLDHFQCYSAAVASPPPSALPGPPFTKTAPAVLLKNGFSTSGMLAATGAVRTLCNPTRKVLPGGAATPVTNPSAHLVCWGIRPNAATLPSLVTLHNQFGNGTLHPIAAKELCVPSWKNPDSPTFSTATAPSGLDHFTCYSVSTAGTASFRPPSSVTLTDEFGTHMTSVGSPNVLCMVSQKIIQPGSNPPPLANPTHDAVCFAIPSSTTFSPRTVFAKDQFGVGAIHVTANQELCVPSTIIG